MSFDVQITFVGLCTFARQEESKKTFVFMPPRHHHHGDGESSDHVPDHVARLYLGPVEPQAPAGAPWSISLDRAVLRVSNSRREDPAPLPTDLFDIDQITQVPVADGASATPPDFRFLRARVELDLGGSGETFLPGVFTVEGLDGRRRMATFTRWKDTIPDGAKLTIQVTYYDAEGKALDVVDLAIPEFASDTVGQDRVVSIAVYHVPEDELPPATPPEGVANEPVTHWVAYNGLFDHPVRAVPAPVVAPVRVDEQGNPLPEDDGDPHSGGSSTCMNNQAKMR